MNEQRPNRDYINQSLMSQIARLSMQVAERDAIITEQAEEIKSIKHTQIEEMNAVAEDELEEGDDGGHK